MWRAPALLLFACPLLFAQGTIEGVVLNRITREPVPAASVDLAGAPGSPLHTTAGVSGLFRFTGLPPGDYTPAFDADHFFAAKGDPVHIRASETLQLEAELDPITTLDGRVLDPDGKPLPGMRVELKHRLMGLSLVTDSEGRYRVTDLPSGTYLLLARPNRGIEHPGKIEQPPATKDKTVWSPTYYPSVTDPSQAVAVRAAGGELHGYDIRLRSLPVYRVRGTLLDDHGNPAVKIPLTLRPVDSSDSLGKPDAETESGPGGAFEFVDVGPGNWRILSETKRDGVDLAGFAVVAVSRHDEEDVRVRLAAPFALEGSLPPEAHVKNLYLDPVSGPARMQAYAEVDPEGRFRFKWVFPGRYRLNRPRPAGAYLTEVRLGEEDVTGEAFDLAPGSPPLRLVFRFDTGSAHGTVEKGARATVVFFPAAPGDFPAAARCTPEGKFELRDLPPGEYSVVAFNRVEEDRLYDPAFTQRLTRGAVTVRVEPSRPVSLELPLTAWPQ